MHLFTVKQVARILDLTIQAVHYRIRKGIDLVAVKVGGRVFLTDESVLKATRRVVEKKKFKRINPSAKKRRAKRPLKDGEEWRLVARKKRRVQKTKSAKVYRDAVKEVNRVKAVQEAAKLLKKQKRLLRRGGAKKEFL